MQDDSDVVVLNDDPDITVPMDQPTDPPPAPAQPEQNGHCYISDHSTCSSLSSTSSPPPSVIVQTTEQSVDTPPLTLSATLFTAAKLAKDYETGLEKSSTRLSVLQCNIWDRDKTIENLRNKILELNVELGLNMSDTNMYRELIDYYDNSYTSLLTLLKQSNKQLLESLQKLSKAQSEIISLQGEIIELADQLTPWDD